MRLTFSSADTVRDRLPPTPLTVNVNEPLVELAVTVKITCDVPGAAGF